MAMPRTRSKKLITRPHTIPMRSTFLERSSTNQCNFSRYSEVSLRLEQWVWEMASAWSGEMSALKRTIQLFTFMRLLFVKMSSTLQLMIAS